MHMREHKAMHGQYRNDHACPSSGHSNRNGNEHACPPSSHSNRNGMNGSTKPQIESTSLSSMPSISTSDPMSTSISLIDSSITKDIGYDYVRQHGIIPRPCRREVKEPSKTDKAMIKTESLNFNFAHTMISNIDKDINYSPMPDKFKIKMDDQNRLHIWINRHTIKYQEWDSNLVATIPLHTSSEMKYLQWVDYSEENVP
eukprot:87878_1